MTGLVGWDIDRFLPGAGHVLIEGQRLVHRPLPCPLSGYATRFPHARPSLHSNGQWQPATSEDPLYPTCGGAQPPPRFDPTGAESDEKPFWIQAGKDLRTGFFIEARIQLNEPDKRA
jgi:hypothetical protein